MPSELNSYRRYLLMFVVNLAVVIGVIYLLRRDEPRELKISLPSPAYETPAYGTVAVPFPSASAPLRFTTVPIPSRATWFANTPAPISTSPGTVAAPLDTVTDRPSAAGKINLNSASLQELMTLPRIGETIAQRIIEYREQHGGFKTIEEIKEVRGIGDVVFDEIKDLISVE